MKTKGKWFRRFETLVAMSMLLASTAAGAADQWDGILESRGGHSAIFRVSPESGDLVGHVFRDDSTVGRIILSTCVPGLPCALKTVRLSDMDNEVADKLGFADQPAGWQEITAAQGARLVSGFDDYQSEVRTRHGVIAADAQRLTLLWKGKPIFASGEGSVAVLHRFEWGPADLLLVQNMGGAACPALYRLVMVSAKGATPYPAFGTCSDVAYAFMDEDSSGKPRITLRTVEFVGPLGSAGDRHRASRTRVEYVFNGERLTRNGKPEPAPAGLARGAR